LYCNFSGIYSVSPIDGFWDWDLQLDPKCDFGSFASSDQMLDETMCLFRAPEYESYSYSLQFSSGCFVSFNADCSVLQFVNFNGENAGAGHNTVYNLVTPKPKHSSHPKFPHGDAPRDCTIAGKRASTIPKFPFNVNINKLYQNTYFNISYHEDGSYTSMITYAPPTGSKCNVSWAGNYFYTKPQLTSYPNNTLHPYYTSGSVQTHAAVPGTYCTNYLTDPASCEYLTSSSSSYQSSNCFIAWDHFVRGPECTYFRLYDFHGFSGPALQILGKVHDKASSEDNLDSTQNSSAVIFEVAELLLFVFLASFLML